MRNPAGHPSRSLRPWVRALALHGLIGALITMAVAGACALTAPALERSYRQLAPGTPPRRWPGPVPADWPAWIPPPRAAVSHGPPHSGYFVTERRGLRREMLYLNDGSFCYRYEVGSYGFPMLSMRTDWACRQPSLAIFVFPPNLAAFPYSGVGSGKDPSSNWSLMPRMPGFAVDVAVWGGASLALTSLVGGTRRWSRRRRGKCESCGFDFSGTAVGETCPECGR